MNDDGTSAELEGLTMTLAVEHQEGCHFRGVNTWSNESAGGSEPVAGVIHTDGLTVTMVEVGEHPEGGSSAVVRGLLVGEDTLHWEYAGVSGGGDKAVGVQHQPRAETAERAEPLRRRDAAHKVGDDDRPRPATRAPACLNRSSSPPRSVASARCA